MNPSAEGGKKIAAIRHFLYMHHVYHMSSGSGWKVLMFDFVSPPSSTGTQTVRVGKMDLESVVPNSVPETIISVRGQSLVLRLDG